MEIKKSIIISRLDILEHFISVAENCTIAEARKILNSVEIDYEFTESGDYDKGNYYKELKEITIYL